jgi:hypothetical protein
MKKASKKKAPPKIKPWLVAMTAKQLETIKKVKHGVLGTFEVEVSYEPENLWDDNWIYIFKFKDKKMQSFWKELCEVNEFYGNGPGITDEQKEVVKMNSSFNNGDGLDLYDF